jgi:hypothetical protein
MFITPLLVFFVLLAAVLVGVVLKSVRVSSEARS